MSLPVWTTRLAPDASGDAAVPQNNFEVSIVLEKSFVQSCLPVAVSHAFRMPVTPSVKRRLPIKSGVAFGPFAIFTAYWFFLKSAAYVCCQRTLPSARLIAKTTSDGSRRACRKTLPFETTGEE